MAKSDCRKGTFDRIRCSDVTPVLRWKVIERQQRVSILPKALHGRRVLRFERVDEQIKRFESFFFLWGIPDRMQHSLRLGLN